MLKKSNVSMEEIFNVDYDFVVDLILEQNAIGFFQGKSEGGPRALGNRSILFDPRNYLAKDIVNNIKQREWFRPFAGTVLLEHANEWFEMETLKESQFMMYAMKVKENKKSLIPGIIHVDDTCRIQTVTEEQNYHYYNLINSFYKKTEVPIVFNTSLNLAGEVLSYTDADAINVLYESELEYLYFPEKQKLVVVKN